MKLKFSETLIPKLCERYSYSRGEQELIDLHQVVSDTGHLSKDQLRKVAVWKSPRSAGRVENNAPEYVRDISRFAFSTEVERSRIESLTLLDGVRWPTASVILHFFHTDPYPILDFRALWSLGLEVPNAYTFEFWWPYVEFCRQVAERNGINMRTLDQALWQYSKENQAGAVDPHVTNTGKIGAEAIRDYVAKQVIAPALEADEDEIRIRAGDIHSALGLKNRMPAVCSVLRSNKFAYQYNLQLVNHEGPKQGVNAVYTFKTQAQDHQIALPNPRQSSTKQTKQPLNRPTNTKTAKGTVYLVSCVSQKQPKPTAAKDLYISALFSKARDFVESKGAPWYILSAKYGLVTPEKVISPYDLTLNKMGVTDRRRWADQVLKQLYALKPKPKRMVMLAGARYREFLEPQLKAQGIEVEVPMEGLRIGEQLSWLSRNYNSNRLDDLRRFYDLLEQLEEILGGKRKLADCHAKMGWPRRGVYFFFEAGERRSDSGSGPRVVRVGTHALKANSGTSLWNRLSQHRGTLKTGGGNHRGSIFRLLVGAAMKQRDSLDEPLSWDVGSDPGAAARELNIDKSEIKRSEASLEQVVSQNICAMPFLWLDVSDPPGKGSLRAHIERNSIALLSNYSRNALDPASKNWLGQYSDRPRVVESGLWNNNHVNEEYDPNFLDALKKLIKK